MPLHLSVENKRPGNWKIKILCKICALNSAIHMFFFPLNFGLQYYDSSCTLVSSRFILYVIWQDNKEARHIKTYEVVLKDKDFVEGPWSQNNLDNGADLLIPVPPPCCGVLIIGEETIVYCSATAVKAIPIKPVRFINLLLNLSRQDFPKIFFYAITCHNSSLLLVHLPIFSL